MFKNFILAVITVFLLKCMAEEVFDYRPVRFEKYKTADSMKEDLLSKYPLGTGINLIAKDMEQSGARCHVYSFGPSEPKGYSYVIDCSYMTNFLSFHPLREYQVSSYGDKDSRLMKIHVSRYSGLMLITI